MPRVLLAFTLFLAGILCLAQSSQAVNLHVGTGRALLVGAPAWVLPGAAVDLNFSTQQYYVSASGLILPTSVLSLTRASQETVTWADGHLSYVGAGVLAISDLGLQVWEARTNLALQSQLAAGWSGSNSSLSAGTVTAPDATLTGATITTTGANGFVRNSAGVTVTESTNYTASVFLKASSGSPIGVLWFSNASDSDGCSVSYNLTTGTVSGGAGHGSGVFTGATIQPLINGWFRVAITGQLVSGTSAFLQIVLNASGAAINAWGAQTELGAFPSPYIPTTTTSAARAADNISLIGAALGIFQGAAGSAIVATNPIQAGTNSPAIFGSQAGHEILAANSTGTTLLAGTDVAGVNLMAATLGSGSNRMALQSGLSWGPVGRSMVGNGGTVATNSASLGSASAIFLGVTSSTTLSMNGNIQRVTLFNSKLPDATLQGLTQ